MKHRPTITLCAIVRNEASTLGAMLQSVDGLVDAKIVLDTGSTDQSVAIAEAGGAEVHTFTWNDDFAAARNASLELAATDWILVLDADERLERSHHDQLRKLLDQPAAYYLRRRHYTADPGASLLTALDANDPHRELGAAGYYLTNDIRVFPNRRAIRFEGIVHESAERSIRALPDLKVQESGVVIHHIGPLAPRDSSTTKSQWYLELTKRALISAPNDWRSWYQVGAEMQGNSEFEQAISCYTEATKRCPQVSWPWRQLGICLAATRKFSEALSALQRANQIDSGCAMTWNALGIALMELGFYDEAELSFTTSQQLHSGSLLPAQNLERLRERRTR